MKRIFNHIKTGVVLLAFLAVSCEKDEVVNHQTTITESLPSFPDDNSSLDLNIVRSNEMVIFEWEPSKAADNSVVFYELLMDRDNGDFSSPIYKGTPAKLGSENRISLSHSALNEIVKGLDVAELETVKLKWKVVSTNGVNSVSSNAVRSLTVRRALDLPNELFLYGTGTEAGDDRGKALMLKKVSDTRFEVYTSLQPGTYGLVKGPVNETDDVFNFKGSDISDGMGNITVDAGVYRITVDLLTGLNFTEIQSVGLWFAAKNAVSNVLTYRGNGVWEAKDIPIAWAQVSWGKDERYKFRITEKDPAGAVINKFWGSASKDNNRPTPSSAASYYYLNQVDNTQWDYTYKFASESQTTDITLTMQGAMPYTHSITYK